MLNFIQELNLKRMKEYKINEYISTLLKKIYSNYYSNSIRQDCRTGRSDDGGDRGESAGDGQAV